MESIVKSEKIGSNLYEIRRAGAAFIVLKCYECGGADYYRVEKEARYNDEKKALATFRRWKNA